MFCWCLVLDLDSIGKRWQNYNPYGGVHCGCKDGAPGAPGPRGYPGKAGESICCLYWWHVTVYGRTTD